MASAPRRILFVIIVGGLLAGCGSTETVLTEQQKTVTSLTSTVTAVCNAWLDGKVSTRYARPTLSASAALLEKKRAKIASSPDALSDPGVAALSHAEDQLAERIAVLRKALVDSDANTIRQVMATLHRLQP